MPNVGDSFSLDLDKLFEYHGGDRKLPSLSYVDSEYWRYLGDDWDSAFCLYTFNELVSQSDEFDTAVNDTIEDRQLLPSYFADAIADIIAIDGSVCVLREDRRRREFSFPLDVAELEEMLEENSMKDIAQKLDVPYADVRRAVKEYDLTDVASTRLRTMLDEQQLRDAVEDGLGVREMCEKFGVGYSVLRYNLNLYGLKTKKSRAAEPSLTAAQCEEYAEEGFTMSDVARKTGLSYWSVRNAYEKNGVEPARIISAAQWLAENEEEKLRTLVQEGKTIAEIAEEMGETYADVRAALAELGIKATRARVKTELDVDEVEKLIAQGFSMRAIGEELSVSREVVARAIGENEKLDALYADAADVRNERAQRLKSEKLRTSYSKEDRIVLEELVEKRIPQSAMAESMGVSVSKLRAMMTFFGMRSDARAGRSGSSELSEKLSADNLMCYVEDGLTAAEIAESVGCSKYTVYTYLRRAGLTAGKRERTSKVQVEDVAALVHDGKTAAEIAEELHCAPCTVYAVMRKAGLTANRKAPSSKLEEKLSQEKLETYVADGKTAAEIADIVGCSKYTVYSYMRKHGVKTDRKRNAGASYVALVEAHGDEILELATAGMSIRQIAEKLGSTPNIVRAAMRHAGISAGKKTSRSDTLVEERAYDLKCALSEGKSVRAIAEELDTTPDIVRAAMRKLGLQAVDNRGKKKATKEQ